MRIEPVVDHVPCDAGSRARSATRRGAGATSGLRLEVGIDAAVDRTELVDTEDDQLAQGAQPVCLRLQVRIDPLVDGAPVLQPLEGLREDVVAPTGQEGPQVAITPGSTHQVLKDLQVDGRLLVQQFQRDLVLMAFPDRLHHAPIGASRSWVLWAMAGAHRGVYEQEWLDLDDLKVQIREVLTGDLGVAPKSALTATNQPASSRRR